MEREWLPIRYREFYDVPRIFVVDAGDARLVFDCPFDDELDDYRSAYRVYRLAPDADIPDGSWIGLTDGAELAGQISVAAVTLDPTRRVAIDSAVLSFLASSGDKCCE